jgi:uncharacterized protein YwbE
MENEKNIKTKIFSTKNLKKNQKTGRYTGGGHLKAILSRQTSKMSFLFL